MAEEKMELRLINPAESEFLQHIDWNMEEIKAQVAAMMESYTDMVYTPDTMKLAKEDRAKLNKFVKIIEDKRKEIKKKWLGPYNRFEGEIKSVLDLIQEPIKMIDGQIKGYENQQKEEKKSNIQAAYDEVIGDLVEVLPFEKVFDNRYLNQTYKLATAQVDIKLKVEKVRTDLETIDSLESKYKLNAKDVYIKTLDLSRALAENKRLSDLEERMEAEKRRKEEEEAERKRLAEERRKEAEERAKLAEERRKELEARKAAEQEYAGKQLKNITEQVDNVIEEQENGTELDQNVSNKAKNETFLRESGTESASVMGKTIQNIEQQAFVAAVDPFTQQEEEQPKIEEKRYQTRFYAKGTRGQLEMLIQFMNDNGIEYGRIKV